MVLSPVGVGVAIGTDVTNVASRLVVIAGLTSVGKVVCSVTVASVGCAAVGCRVAKLVATGKDTIVVTFVSTLGTALVEVVVLMESGDSIGVVVTSEVECVPDVADLEVSVTPAIVELGNDPNDCVTDGVMGASSGFRDISGMDVIGGFVSLGCAVAGGVISTDADTEDCTLDEPCDDDDSGDALGLVPGTKSVMDSEISAGAVVLKFTPTVEPCD